MKRTEKPKKKLNRQPKVKLPRMKRSSKNLLHYPHRQLNFFDDDD